MYSIITVANTFDVNLEDKVLKSIEKYKRILKHV